MIHNDDYFSCEETAPEQATAQQWLSHAPSKIRTAYCYN